MSPISPLATKEISLGWATDSHSFPFHYFLNVTIKYVKI